MSILLTNEQINEIRFLQANLDQRIREEHSLEGKDLSLEKHLALKTELFELINEVESFKYWKKNKGKDSILEEACDVLHFVMSIAIDNDVEIKDLKIEGDFSIDDYNMNEVFGIMDSMTIDCFLRKDYSDLIPFVILMCIVLKKCGFEPENLYNAYIAKNKVNHDRQDNKY